MRETGKTLLATNFIKHIREIRPENFGIWVIPECPAYNILKNDRTHLRFFCISKYDDGKGVTKICDRFYICEFLEEEPLGIYYEIEDKMARDILKEMKQRFENIWIPEWLEETILQNF